MTYVLVFFVVVGECLNLASYGIIFIEKPTPTRNTVLYDTRNHDEGCLFPFLARQPSLRLRVRDRPAGGPIPDAIVHV